MELRQQIQKDLHDAMKNQEESRISILRLLWDAIIKKEKEKRMNFKNDIGENIDEKSQITEQELLQIISSLVKRAKDATIQFKQGNRNDLAKKEEEEVIILQEYLPEQLKEDEIRKLVGVAIKETNANSMKDIGKVMESLMPKTQGRADGKIIAKMVKEILS